MSAILPTTWRKEASKFMCGLLVRRTAKDPIAGVRLYAVMTADLTCGIEIGLLAKLLHLEESVNDVGCHGRSFLLEPFQVTVAPVSARLKSVVVYRRPHIFPGRNKTLSDDQAESATEQYTHSVSILDPFVNFSKETA